MRCPNHPPKARTTINFAHERGVSDFRSICIHKFNNQVYTHTHAYKTMIIQIHFSPASHWSGSRQISVQLYRDRSVCGRLWRITQQQGSEQQQQEQQKMLSQLEPDRPKSIKGPGWAKSTPAFTDTADKLNYVSSEGLCFDFDGAVVLRFFAKPFWRKKRVEEQKNNESHDEDIDGHHNRLG